MFITTLVLFLLVSFSPIAKANSTATPITTPPATSVALNSEPLSTGLSWLSMKAAQNGELVINMSWQDTSRWFGVGFCNCSSMGTADMIMCKHGETPVCTDRRGRVNRVPSIDPIQNIQFTETIVGGKWTVFVRRMMNTGDPNDFIITNATQKVIWAWGTGSTSKIHSERGTFDFNPSTGSISGLTSGSGEEDSFHLYPLYAASLGVFAFVILVGVVVYRSNHAPSLYSRIGPAKLHSTAGFDSIVEMSMGELLFVIGFLVALALAMIGHYFVHGGIWGMSSRICLGLIVFPVTRGTVAPFTFLFGMSFERALKYHRMLGRLFIVSTTLHFAMICYWKGFYYAVDTTPGGDNSSPRCPPLWGILAWLSMGIMGLLAFEPVRRKFYVVFWYSHVVLFVITVVFSCLHDKWSIVLVFCSGFFYVLDYRIRIRNVLRTVTHVQIKPVGAGPDFVKFVLTVPGIKWGPADYVFVDLGQGMAHPFTIASSPCDHSPHTLTLCVKNMGPGTWTESICKTSPEKLAENIRVDGPYGTLMVPLGSYETVFLVAGGIGVTPMMSILGFLSKRKYRSVRNVIFVWSLRDESLLFEFTPALEEALKKRHGPAPQILIYMTKKKKPSRQTEATGRQLLYEEGTLSLPMHGSSTERSPLVGDRLPMLDDGRPPDFAAGTSDQLPGKVLEGRPDFAALFSQEAPLVRVGSAAALYLCGPDEFVVAAINASRSAPYPVHVHTEKFYF